jgi:threonine synthase
MQEFSAARSLTIPKPVLTELQRRYLTASGSDAETKAAIARVHAEFGLVIDPHTAVGVAAADKLGAGLKGPVVLLATAHPAKFADAIMQAIGKTTEIPPKLAGIMTKEERYTVLPSEVGAVRTFVLERTGTS